MPKDAIRGSRLFKFGAALSVFFIFFAVLFYLFFLRGLPSIDAVKDYQPNLVTRVYSADGQVIGEFYIERRMMVSMKKIPDHLVKAFLAAEDAEFYRHEGISYISILRAFYKNITAGKIVQGGSTITQQVARSLFLSPEKKISRKIKEMILARRIERRLSKDEILNLYLNQIYLGNGAYGVEAASQAYFGKDVEEVDLAEAALLAGLPKAPSKYSPYANFNLAKKRQEYILQRMAEEGFITPEERDVARAEEIKLKPYSMKTLWVGPYFTEHVRRYLEEKYGDDLLYRGGLKVYTTLDVKLQKAANEAVKKGLRAYDRRRGYRGPVKRLLTPEEINNFAAGVAEKLSKLPVKPGKLYDAVITAVDEKTGNIYAALGDMTGVITKKDYRWARIYNPDGEADGRPVKDPLKLFTPGDVVKVSVKDIPAEPSTSIPLRLELEQEPVAEAALVAMDPETGYVKAMVGGSNFSKTQFNRAVQAYRQPGSAFKPIIYAAAFDKGYTPATIIMDTPVVFDDTENDVQWRPRNYDQRFGGPTTVRKALAKSRNVVTIKVLKDIGVNYAVDYARKLGIRTPLASDLSLALGSSAVTLLDLTDAYATFANEGKRPEPLFIIKIIDKDGNVLEDNTPTSEEVLSAQTAFLMTSMLEGVIENGTGWRARALGRPAAGKTGTTNNLNDAWFLGYVPGLACGTWVGYDDEKELGKHETGSRAALPIWLHFMKTATEDTPVRDFPVPDGVEFVRIDPDTGLLAPPGSEKAIFEVFRTGTAPTAVSAPAAAPDTDGFFLTEGGLPPLPPEKEPVESISH